MPPVLTGLFRGFIIGAGAILPGISGASLAVVFGVYEDFTALLANPFANIGPFLRRHAVLCAGIVAGFIAFTLLLDRLFGNRTTELIFLFSGFIAGTLPGIFRDARKKGIGRGETAAFCLAAGIFVFATATGHSGAESLSAHGTANGVMLAAIPPQSWVLAGAVVGAGSLLPGVSASFILLYFGMYGPLLEAAANRDVTLLLLVGGGSVLAMLLLSRLVSALYRRFHGIISFAVLGCTLGSLVLVFPGFPRGTNPAICIALASGGLAASLMLARPAGPDKTPR